MFKKQLFVKSAFFFSSLQHTAASSVTNMLAGLQRGVDHENTRWHRLRTRANKYRNSTCYFKVFLACLGLIFVPWALYKILYPYVAATGYLTFSCPHERGEWATYLDTCFLYASENMTWEEASGHCVMQHSKLLTMQTKPTKDMGLRYFTWRLPKWLGLYRDNVTGEWFWDNGDKYIPDYIDLYDITGQGDCGYLTENFTVAATDCNKRMDHICSHKAALEYIQ